MAWRLRLDFYTGRDLLAAARVARRRRLLEADGHQGRSVAHEVGELVRGVGDEDAAPAGRADDGLGSREGDVDAGSYHRDSRFFGF